MIISHKNLKSPLRPIVGLSLLFLMTTLILSGIICRGWTYPYDGYWWVWFSEHHPTGLPAFFLRSLTHIADEQNLIYLMIFVLIWPFFFRRDKLASLIAFCGLSVSALLDQLLKHLLYHPYPFRGIVQQLHTFPSGHALVAVCFYGFIFYYLSERWQQKYIFSILFPVFALLMGISRLTPLPCHYVSDVIGSYLIGLPLLIISTQIYKRVSEKSFTKPYTSL